MMEAIRYYKDQFGIDLLNVSNATRATIKDRISIVSFIPAASYPGGFGDTAAEFQKVRKKTLFLFCFYFSVLIDQAIHSALRAEHPHFEGLARYPKLCGILGSYHTNLHPALLLVVATLYAANEDPKTITSDFETLSTFFPSDYYRFLVEEYPELTGRLQTPTEQDRSAILLFTELSSATAMLHQPISLRPYSDITHDHNLFTTWSGLVASNINKTLDNIEQSSGPNI